MKPSERMMELFHDSLGRCQSHPEFLSLFYDNFTNTSSEVSQKFHGVDMSRQRKMISASLYMVMLASQGNDAAEHYLSRIAKRHSKQELDIRPELYDLWLQALLQTVRNLDVKLNSEVEQAWQEIMSYGVEYLKSRYLDQSIPNDTNSSC